MTPQVAPRDLTAVEAAAAIREGRLSSVELVRSCLERIAEREGAVRAWAHIDAEHALAQARACDERPADGALHGVPVGVKDLIDTVDLPTEYGSPIYAGHRPTADAACVARLRAAGAVILGKTVTTEFALYEPGPTRNPRALDRTPGGSSSGSAAAVADGMVPLALATQTAGSVIRPAAFCGVFGIKPTFGAVPVDGVRPAAPSLDTVGVLARCPEDLVVATEVLTGRPLPLPQLAGRVRVGVLRTPWWEAAAPSTRSALDELAARLADRADVAEVVDLDVPPPCDELADAQSALMAAEVAVSLAPERRDHPDLLSASLADLLAHGDATGPDEVDRARAVAEQCAPLVDEALASCHVVVAPAVLGEAPDPSSTGDPLLCRAWTLLGLPTVAVPGLVGLSGLPLGAQVLAQRGRDEQALAAASWLAERIGATRGEGAGGAGGLGGGGGAGG